MYIYIYIYPFYISYHVTYDMWYCTGSFKKKCPSKKHQSDGLVFKYPLVN